MTAKFRIEKVEETPFSMGVIVLYGCVITGVLKGYMAVEGITDALRVHAMIKAPAGDTPESSSIVLRSMAQTTADDGRIVVMLRGAASQSLFAKDAEIYFEERAMGVDEIKSRKKQSIVMVIAMLLLSMPFVLDGLYMVLGGSTNPILAGAHSFVELLYKFMRPMHNL